MTLTTTAWAVRRTLPNGKTILERAAFPTRQDAIADFETFHNVDYTNLRKRGLAKAVEVTVSAS